TRSGAPEGGSAQRNPPGIAAGVGGGRCADPPYTQAETASLDLLVHPRKIDPLLRCFEHTRSFVEFQGESVATIDEHLAGQLPRRLYGSTGSPLIQAAISSA